MESGWLLLVDRMRDVLVIVVVCGAAAAAAVTRPVVCGRVIVVV